jgi:hypothetical protein
LFSAHPGRGISRKRNQSDSRISYNRLVDFPQNHEISLKYFRSHSFGHI